MSQKKAIDATAAEAAVRRMLEGQYGGKIRSLTFGKVWYTAAATREFWEVRGVLIYRKGVFSKERRNSRYASTDQVLTAVAGEHGLTLEELLKRYRKAEKAFREAHEILDHEEYHIEEIDK